MSVDRLHIICGNCGHDAKDGNFTWRHRPEEDYGNGEFNSADVLISCKNCGTLHGLGKYMQEESEGKMSKIICPNCGSIRVVEAPRRGVSICLACESFFSTVDGKSKQNVFDRITASPEVLAEVLVYCENTEHFAECASWRSVILGNTSFAKKEDAVAATVAKLREVER